MPIVNTPDGLVMMEGCETIATKGNDEPLHQFERRCADRIRPTMITGTIVMDGFSGTDKDSMFLIRNGKVTQWGAGQERLDASAAIVQGMADSVSLQ